VFMRRGSRSKAHVQPLVCYIALIPFGLAVTPWLPLLGSAQDGAHGRDAHVPHLPKTCLKQSRLPQSMQWCPCECCGPCLAYFCIT
jgi:hypothetical protein